MDKRNKSKLSPEKTKSTFLTYKRLRTRANQIVQKEDRETAIIPVISLCSSDSESDGENTTGPVSTGVSASAEDRALTFQANSPSHFSQHDVSFIHVKSFEDFTNKLDVSNPELKLPVHIQRKYYELCFSQQMFLHENLIKGLDLEKLVTGVISETINIADAIKEMKYAKTSIDYLEVERWDKTLESFAVLGMRVGFLRDEIHTMLGPYWKSLAELKRKERDDAVKEMRCVESKIHSTRELIQKLDLESCDLVDELDSEFIKIASASW